MASGTLPEGLVHLDDFVNPQLRTLAEQLLNNHTPAQILADATDDLRSQVAELLSGDSYDNDSDRLKAASDCLRNMRENRMNAQMEALKEQLSTANDEQRRILLRQMMELQTAMKH